MDRMKTSSQNSPIVNAPHAKWVARVLTMLIAVVGRESLLGLILRQTRSEISSIVADERPAAASIATTCYKNN
jgi:hypothetical protein